MVAAEVTGMRGGDDVYRDLPTSGLGGIAEYVAGPATGLTLEQPSLSFVDAASAPPGWRAGGLAATRVLRQ